MDFSLLFMYFKTVNKHWFCISVIGYINVQIIGSGCKKSITVDHYSWPRRTQKANLNMLHLFEYTFWVLKQCFMEWCDQTGTFWTRGSASDQHLLSGAKRAKHMRRTPYPWSNMEVDHSVMGVICCFRKRKFWLCENQWSLVIWKLFKWDCSGEVTEASKHLEAIKQESFCSKCKWQNFCLIILYMNV